MAEHFRVALVFNKNVLSPFAPKLIFGGAKIKFLG